MVVCAQPALIENYIFPSTAGWEGGHHQDSASVPFGPEGPEGHGEERSFQRC